MKIPKGIRGISAYPVTLNLMWSSRITSTLCVKPFQRPYSWSSDQIEALFRDQFFPLANPKANGDVPNSFIGAVVILPESGGAELVDGQQRLTTLTMTIGIGCKMLKNIGYTIPESCRSFYKRFSNHQWIRVKPANESCYSKVMDPGLPLSELNNYLLNDDSEMSKAAGTIESSIEDYIEIYGGKRGDAIKSLLDIIAEEIGLVVIQVKSHSQALDVFQALNAGGMPLTLDQLVKSLIHKISEKLGSEIEKYIDDAWEGASGDSFYECIKSPTERSDFLIYYYKGFIGSISTRSAYLNYKNWLEEGFSKASNKRDFCHQLISHLREYWVFYSRFNPILYQMGAKILVPALFASREKIKTYKVNESALEKEMHHIAFSLECGFSRVILMKSSLAKVDSKITSLCRTLAKLKSVDEIHLEIKNFYCQRSFGLDDDARFRRSIEEYKFKNTNKVAILLLRRVHEAIRSKSFVAKHQLGINESKAKFSTTPAIIFDKNIANKSLLSLDFVSDGNIDVSLYKTLTNSISNLILTSDLVVNAANLVVNKPWTKAYKVNKSFLEKRGKRISSCASKIWSIS